MIPIGSGRGQASRKQKAKESMLFKVICGVIKSNRHLIKSINLTDEGIIRVELYVPEQNYETALKLLECAQGRGVRK